MEKKRKKSQGRLIGKRISRGRKRDYRREREEVGGDRRRRRREE